MLPAMRGWGLACSIAVAASSSAARAQPVESAPAPVLGQAALPGGLHVPIAAGLPAGSFAFTALGGFGWRSGLLSSDHRFGRGIGNLGIAYAPIESVAFALALDGRYDRHYGVEPRDEDSYVGDPRVFLRVAPRVAPRVRIGAQLALWLPGMGAPSVRLDAVTVEARALAAFELGPATLGVNAGFRLDNSANAVDMTALSDADRVSLGVSDVNAVVGGVHLAVRRGRAVFGGEASIDAFVGDGAPDPMIRGGVHAGVQLTAQLALLVFAEVAKVPGTRLDDTGPRFELIAFEPMITGGLSLQGVFGGARPGATAKPTGTPSDDEPAVRSASTAYAELRGVIVDERGKPVVGARVTVGLRDVRGTAITDAAGAYAVERLPIGTTTAGVATLTDASAAVAVEVEGKKPTTTSLTLVVGENTAPKIALESLLPPGQLKAIVRSAGTGRPIANATVTIEPGGITATSGADGRLSVDLAPGSYKATCAAPGVKSQTLDVTVDPNGVAIKNFELSK